MAFTGQRSSIGNLTIQGFNILVSFDGTFVNGSIYLSGAGIDDDNEITESLFIVNIANRTISRVGSVNDYGVSEMTGGIAHNSNNNTTYFGASRLYQINLSTGVASNPGADNYGISSTTYSSIRIDSFAYDNRSNILYAVFVLRLGTDINKNYLCTINTTTGVATIGNELNTGRGNRNNPDHIDDIFYSEIDRKLYGISGIGLYEINTTNANLTQVGSDFATTNRYTIAINKTNNTTFLVTNDHLYQLNQSTTPTLSTQLPTNQFILENETYTEDFSSYFDGEPTSYSIGTITPSAPVLNASITNEGVITITSSELTTDTTYRITITATNTAGSVNAVFNLRVLNQLFTGRAIRINPNSNWSRLFRGNDLLTANALEWIDGTLYMMTRDSFWSVDRETAVPTRVGSIFGVGATYGGMAWDGTTLWAAVGIFVGSSDRNAFYKGEFISINHTNARVTRINKNNFGVNEEDPRGLAWDGSNLWMIGKSGNIYTINRQNGIATKVSEISDEAIFTTGHLTWANNRLYGIKTRRISTDVFDSSLHIINPRTGQSSRVGNNSIIDFGILGDQGGELNVIGSGLAYDGKNMFMLGRRTGANQQSDIFARLYRLETIRELKLLPRVTFQNVPTKVFASPFTIDVIFNVNVTGVSNTDFRVLNATNNSVLSSTSISVTPIMSSRSSYRLSVTIPEEITGNLVIECKADSATSIDENLRGPQDATRSPSIAYDTRDPNLVTADFSGEPSGDNIRDPFSMGIIFSEDVSGLTTNDFQTIDANGNVLTNIVSDVQGSGTDYMIICRPAIVDHNGNIKIQLKSNTVYLTGQSASQSFPVMPISSNNININTLPATFTIGTPDFARSININIYIRSNVDVVGLEANDISISRGTVVGLDQINRRTWILRVRLPDNVNRGFYYVSIPENVITSPTRNNAVRSRNSIFRTGSDTERPTVTSWEIPTETQGGGYEITVVFSEPVTGLTQEDFSITGGGSFLLAGVLETSQIVSAIILIYPPEGQIGSQTITLRADAVRDLASRPNTNEESTSPEIRYDTIDPHISTWTYPTESITTEEFVVDTLWNEIVTLDDTKINAIARDEDGTETPLTFNRTPADDIASNVFRFDILGVPKDKRGRITLTFEEDAATDGAENRNVQISSESLEYNRIEFVPGAPGALVVVDFQDFRLVQRSGWYIEVYGKLNKKVTGFGLNALLLQGVELPTPKIFRDIIGDGISIRDDDILMPFPQAFPELAIPTTADQLQNTLGRWVGVADQDTGNTVASDTFLILFVTPQPEYADTEGNLNISILPETVDTVETE